MLSVSDVVALKYVSDVLALNTYVLGLISGTGRPGCRRYPSEWKGSWEVISKWRVSRAISSPITKEIIMAEIKIEKKKPMWPWILLGLGVIAVLIYFLAFNDSNEQINKAPKISKLIVVKEMHEVPKTSDLIIAEETDLTSVKENNSTVEAYVNFVETGRNKMSLDHEYTNEAFLKLIEATDAMAGEVGYEVQADLDKVKEYAEMITNNPFETTDADNIRKADDVLTNVLRKIQMAKYPGLTNEVAELKNASESIKPGVMTLDQKDEVTNFFNKASELLKKMN
jgi:hypothetical protein